MADRAFILTAANGEARRHRERTIDQAVSLAEIGQYDQAVARALQALGVGAVRCWGSKPGAGNLRSWEHMQPGDRGFLYAGDGQFPLTLPVIHKARSATLAEHFWNRDADGSTWELMFFFGNPTQVDLTTDDVRASLGYDERWWPQGLQYPTPDHQEALLDKFGSLPAFVASSVRDEANRNGQMPTPSGLLFGGAFTGVSDTPRKPPQRATEYDPDVAGRGHRAHEETVEKLAEHVGSSFRKGTPGINHDGGWEAADAFHITEVKSITAKNEVSQLQKGLGQILHNCFKASRNGVEAVKGYLVAERKPANSQLWKDLSASVGIRFTWPERFDEDIPRGA